MELGHLVNVLLWEGMWVNLIRWVKYLTGSRKSVRFLIMFWVYCPFSHFDEWLAQKPFEMNAIKLAHPFWCWLFYDLEVTAEFQKKTFAFFSLIAVIVRTYIFRSFFEMPFSTFLLRTGNWKNSKKFFWLWYCLFYWHQLLKRIVASSLRKCHNLKLNKNLICTT